MKLPTDSPGKNDIEDQAAEHNDGGARRSPRGDTEETAPRRNVGGITPASPLEPNSAAQDEPPGDNPARAATPPGLPQEVAKLSRALVQAHRDHARELEQAMAARDQLEQTNETLSRQLSEARSHFRLESEESAKQLTELSSERDRLGNELDQWRTHHKREIEALTRERDDAGHERDDLHRKLADTLEAHRQVLGAMTEERDRLAGEHSKLSSTLDETRDSHRQQADKLQKERSALEAHRDELSRALAKAIDDHKAELARLTEQTADALQERAKLVTEFENFRDSHDAEIAALRTEREKLTAAAAELRANGIAFKEGHRHEVDAIRHEQTALINECNEAHALLESDRTAWRRQIELFAAERETLVRERDEVAAELARERHAAEKQAALRDEECANLVKQRQAMLDQVNDLREAQTRQTQLFEEERAVLMREHDTLIAKVEESFQALGEGRATLVQKRNEAEAALAAAKQSHQCEICSVVTERDTAVQERDAARRELEVFRAARSREEASFGKAEGAKFEPKSEMARQGLHMVCEVRDTALGRDVEMRTIRGGGSSEERQTELIDEARGIALLQHPGIPPVYELGFDESGRVFYTIKSVKGMNLRAVLDELKKGRTGSLLHFSLRRLLGIFHRVCDALAYAHAKDVTHGSLDPEQIVLGDFGEVFVTNWGAAQAEAVAQNMAADFHPRDDIMALGRILYEIATLQTPPNGHPGEFDHGAAKRAWKEEKGVEALADTARRAMNRKGAEKFYSVRELQLRVDSFRDNFEHEARLTVRRILRMWVQRHKVAVIVTVALIAAGAIGAGVIIIQQRGGAKNAAPSPQPPARLELNQPSEAPRLPAPVHKR